MIIWIVTFLFIFLGPATLTAVAFYLIYLEFGHPDEFPWMPIIPGIALLVVSIVLSYVLSSYRYGSGRLQSFAFGGTLLSGMGAIIAMVLITRKLRGMGRTVTLLFGMLFPIALFGVTTLADYVRENPPELVTRRRAEAIVQASHQYFADNQTYPARLSDLVPDYLPSILEPTTNDGMGWRYRSGRSGYVLGYWYWPPGTSRTEQPTVCMYTSANDAWGCRVGGWYPFPPAITPVPTPGE